MRYILFDHQQKSRAFSDALARRGYNPASRIEADYRDVKFVLTDNAVLSKQRRLEELRKAGVSKFFLYPHAGRPSLVPAFYEGWKYITAEFVSAPGHVEVMQRAGNENKLHVIGWSLCPLREFHPRSEVHNVLFAPIHPRNSAIDRKVNQAVLNKLYPLAKSGRIRLTIRYLAPFEGNGIKRYDDAGIEYMEGTAGPAWQQIDAADVVISHQTFAFLAVARGVPTLMMGEDIRPHVEFRNGTFIEAKGWEDYRDLLMYPLDFLYADDSLGMMEKAAQDDEAIRGWKSRMIGVPFDGDGFVNRIESYF